METSVTISMSLSDAKARLSEVVRAARQHGQEAIITVDGEPAVRLVPVPGDPRQLTEVEVATYTVLMRVIRESARVGGEFDAVDLVAEGRR
jgi:prevent-host-death family protein